METKNLKKKDTANNVTASFFNINFDISMVAFFSHSFQSRHCGTSSVSLVDHLFSLFL